jgi:hypothetical protein
MWILSFIPDSILQLAVFGTLCTGIGLYLGGLLMNFWPATRPYREPVRIIATVLTIVGAYFYGSYDTEMTWRKRVEDMQAKVAVAEEKSKTANVTIDNKIQTKTKVVHDVQVVVKERIREIAAKADAECKVDPEIVKSLNKAATASKDSK